MSLTPFFEHLDLQVFIFRVFNCVVVCTVVILITEAAGIKHLVRWKQVHQNPSEWFYCFSQVFFVQLKVTGFGLSPYVL